MATATRRNRPTAPTAPTTLTGMFGRGRELALLLAMFLCAFGLISLADWRPGDPTWGDAKTGTAENLCGPVGAVLADGLYTLVGFGAWAILVPLLVAALAIAGRPTMRWHRWLAVFTGYVALLGMLDLVWATREPHLAGGIVGAGLTAALASTVGSAGAVLALGGTVIGAVTIVGRIDWRSLFARAMGRAEDVAPKVGAVGAGVGRWAGGRMQALLVAGWRVGTTRARRDGLRFVSATTRMAQSLRRGTSPGVEHWDDSGFEEDGAADESSLPPSDPDVDDATAVGNASPRLVEVEWDATVATVATAPAPSGAGTQGDELLGMFPSLGPREVRQSEATDDPPTPPPSAADALEPAVPAALQGKVKARKVPAMPPGAAGVVVHGAAHLNERVKDDGGAISADRHFDPPRLSLLDEVPPQRAVFNDDDLRYLAGRIEEKLVHFKITGRVTDVRPGPVVTIFEFQPDPGVKVSRIAGLSDDLAMALEAMSVRIVAPIPGKGVVGIEIPSPTRLTIYLRDVLASEAFRSTERALPCTLGKDVSGLPVIADLAAMPHLLVGGTTGSGKSVGVNGMLMSMLFRRTPDELRLLLIDPKMLEFGLYEDIPHLLHPVVTEPKGAAAALAWACREMDDRYALLKRWKTRNITSYNKKVEKLARDWNRQLALEYATADDDDEGPPSKLPYIVVVIDELADLMMVAKKEVETNIARLAQKARACGIHLIVATQRPSVDVITGVIKANLPTRIAFQLRTATDSRTVLGTGGADALLGRGDMLFLPPGTGTLQRCHGAFVSDEEVQRVMDHLRAQGKPNFVDDMCHDSSDEADLAEEFERDELFEAAVEIVVRAGKASTSMIQRHLKIGYNRAARIVDSLEAAGIVGPADGARPREVLVDGL